VLEFSDMRLEFLNRIDKTGCSSPPANAASWTSVPVTSSACEAAHEKRTKDTDNFRHGRRMVG
jgi:hypothetical protein